MPWWSSSLHNAFVNPYCAWSYSWLWPKTIWYIENTHCPYLCSWAMHSIYASKIINDTDPSSIEKVYTHSFQGFTNYVKMIKIDSYAIDCLIANYNICHHAWHTQKSNVNVLCSGFIMYEACLCCHVFKFTTCWGYGVIANYHFWDSMFHVIFCILNVY